MALDAMDYEKKDDFIVNYQKNLNTVNEMVDCPYFKTNYINLSVDMVLNVSNRDSFIIYMCVSGSATVVNDFGEATVKKGETVLVPANSKKVIIKTDNVTLLEVTI
jgi:mannose-6-phosphate isomerase